MGAPLSSNMSGSTVPPSNTAPVPESPEPKPDRNWCRRYFCLEQQGFEGVSPEAAAAQRKRKIISLVIPAVVAWLVWWPWAISGDKFYYYTDEDNGSANNVPRYYLSITMIFGSMIAGLTSEGGAAAAFPIVYQSIKVEWYSIVYVTIAGVAGIIVSLEEIDPLLDPPFKKMYFVCIWGVFALSLFLLNKFRTRKRYIDIPDWEGGQLVPIPGVPAAFNPLNWKAALLMCFGFLGGIFSGVAGSGIDICSFACLTLIFRVNERTATPTSVILMAINTSVGFMYREFGMGGVQDHAWGFWAVCIPIVVVGAPMGAMLSSHLHRLTLAGILYAVDFAQFVGALVVVKPWKHKRDGGKTDKPFNLCATSLAIMFGGAGIFGLMAWSGLKLSDHIAEKEEAALKAAAIENGTALEEGKKAEPNPLAPVVIGVETKDE